MNIHPSYVDPNMIYMYVYYLINKIESL